MSRRLSLFTVPLLFVTATALSAEESTEQPQPWQWMLGLHTNYQDTLRNPESASQPLLYSVQRIEEADAEGIVLISEQAYLFNPEQPLRRRIYQFIPRRDGWIQHIFEVSKELSSGELQAPEHWQPVHGCSIRWEQNDNHFSGANRPRECYFFVQDSGERVSVASNIQLFANYFVVNDDFTFTAEAESDSGINGIDHSVQSEYQRTTFYDAQISYSALSDDDWESVDPTGLVHDQGARVGLVLEASGLELRYQLELQRTLSSLTFKLHDLSRGEVVHEENFATDVEVVEFNSRQLSIRLKPRP